MTHPRQPEFDAAYTNAVFAWTKHMHLHHSVRKSVLYTGQMGLCSVCHEFKRRVKA